MQIIRSRYVNNLQKGLYKKAKHDKSHRFINIYEKIHHSEVLREAFNHVKSRHSGPGPDNVTFRDIENQGVQNYLDDLQTELKEKKYQTGKAKTIEIPKGKLHFRKIQVFNIRDRIMQCAAKLLLEPIFEAGFINASYGYRPLKSRKEAIIRLASKIQKGKTKVYSADITSFFDNVYQPIILELLNIKLADSDAVELVSQWFTKALMPDIETNSYLPQKGIPQGSVISPLLANIYLHVLDTAVTYKNDAFKKKKIDIIRYADDFVLVGKKVGKKIVTTLKEELATLQLKLNDEKSEKIDLQNMPVNFLGFSLKATKEGSNNPQLEVVPDKVSVANFKSKLISYLNSSKSQQIEILTADLNIKLQAWVRSFSIPELCNLNKALGELDSFLYFELNRYFNYYRTNKENVGKNAYKHLKKKYGLIDIKNFASNL